MDVFEEAYKDCLKQCFETMAIRISSAEAIEEVEKGFKRCCEICKKCKETAATVNDDEPKSA